MFRDFKVQPRPKFRDSSRKSYPLAPHIIIHLTKTPPPTGSVLIYSETNVLRNLSLLKKGAGDEQ